MLSNADILYLTKLRIIIKLIIELINYMLVYYSNQI